MRSIPLAVLLGVALSGAALAQSGEDLKAAGKNPGEILTYGMSYSQQRFSPLKQIDRQTAKRLVPAWSYSMANNTGEESQVLLRGALMYVTHHDKTAPLAPLTPL